MDASRYFTQAKHLETYGVEYFIREWGLGINAWTDMPLLPFLYGLILRYAGESKTYIGMFTTVLFSLSVVITYLLGKRIWNEDVGFYGAVLLLGIPHLLTQVPLMLVDVPTMFFLLLSLWTFIEALERGGWMMVVSAVAIFLAFFSKYSNWLMLSVLGVAYLVYLEEAYQPAADAGGTPDDRRRTLFYRGISVFSAAALLIGAVLLYKAEVFSGQMQFLIAYQKPGLKRWGESFTSTFFFQINPLITASAVCSVYFAFRKRDLKFLITAWLVTLVVAMGIKRIRYIIMVFPMLSLMASYGLFQIRDRVVVRYTVLCIVIFSLVIAVFVYLPFLLKNSAVNLKNAGDFLNGIDETNVMVFTPLPEDPVVNPAVAVPLLDLYTKKNIIYDYNAGEYQQPWSEIETSPLRFSWEYRNPEYYAGKGHTPSDTAIAVISEDTDKPIPEHLRGLLKDYHQVKAFSTYEGTFRFRTNVKVYRSGNPGG